MKQSTLDDFETSGAETCDDCGREFKNLSVHHGMTDCGPQSHKRQLTCEVCGTEYERYQCHIGRGKGEGKYCSQECQAKGQQTGEERTCKWCGGEFYRPDCHINRDRGTKHHGDFCSVDCAIEWRQDVGYFAGDNHPMWKGGHSVVGRVRSTLAHTSWPDVADEYRSKVNCCEMCGVDGERALDVHHIVPIASGGLHGDWNLLALCRSCHRTVEVKTKQFTEPHLLKYES